MEKRVIVDFRWGLPARLWRARAVPSPVAQAPLPTKIASGSLEEMVRVATSAPETERPAMFIDCDDLSEPLTWPMIQRLSRRVEFPVVI